MLGYLRRIIPFSSVDGPGNRTVVFLQGCNFSCHYCHNPETQPFYNSAMTAGGIRQVEHLELIDEILIYEDFIQGVTISGGECTVQYAFLLELCRALKERGIEVFIDTNGHLVPEKFSELAQYVDKFMFDVKAMDEAEHRALTGESNKLVLVNLEYAIAERKLYEIRTVVGAGILNAAETVVKASRLISVDASIRYKLIKFRNRGVLSGQAGLSAPSTLEMERLSALARQNGVADCRIV